MHVRVITSYVSLPRANKISVSQEWVCFWELCSEAIAHPEELTPDISTLLDWTEQVPVFFGTYKDMFTELLY
jgi:hypothetical protein